MKKRNLMLGTAIMLAVLLVAGGTLAWFTASADPVENKFTAGTLEIELIDEFDEEAAGNVNPGDCYEKRVYVKNLGTKRAFIRIKKEMAFNPELPLDVVHYELGENWVEHNGYFYYTQEVAAEGGITSDLFEFMPCEENGIEPAFFGKIKCPVCGIKYWPWLGHGCPGNPDPDPDPEDPTEPPCGGHICFDGAGMGNEYQGASFKITVNAEAIQVTNDAALEEWEVNPLDL